ncbi:MAG: squalene/phytoene synthase family protein [Planctomycetota bacterium]
MRAFAARGHKPGLASARARPHNAPVHALLVPADVSRAEALARCEAYLATKVRHWKLARLGLPRAARDGFVALLAWHSLARELADLPSGFERRRGLDELGHELELALRENPASAIGRALSYAARRHELAEELLRRPLLERGRDEHLATFETREALLGHARALAVPEGRLYLALFGQANARNEALADACALALQRTHWLAHLGANLARGRVHLPMDELLRARVELGELTRNSGELSPALVSVLASELRQVRELYARGWNLCPALGPLRGRLLAFVLRWHAATLAALEARALDVRRGPPSAGWLRLLACASASLFSSAAPRLS